MYAGKVPALKGKTTRIFVKNILFILFATLSLATSACSDDSITAAGHLVSGGELDIENPTAAAVMSRSYSTFDAGSPSFLDNSGFHSLRNSALNNGYRNDQPVGKYISFSSTTATRARLRMATDPVYDRPVLDTEVGLTNGRGVYHLRNFVPGQKYYYAVTIGSDTLTSGTLSTKGQLRMIRVDGSWNIRDLGGWKGWNGNPVRYEWIYRGGSPGGQNLGGNTYSLSDADLAELHRIGIRAHLDLRALPGKGAWPEDGKQNAYSLGYTPLTDAEFINIATDFALFDATKSSAAVGDVAWIIHQLKQGNPVYFHCRTGADRTGTMGYTLLGLLGCDAYTTPSGGNQIAIDYELTSLGMDEEGTIAYNTRGTHPSQYSNRYANAIATSGYNYFRTLRGLSVPGCPDADFQQRCYYYLNRYFLDNDVPTAGRVSISKSDLDWFINFMLGITDREGNLQPGHTVRYEGPSWASDNPDLTLESAYTTAAANQYAVAQEQ